MPKAKAKAKPNITYQVQASLTIVTYNCQSIFIAQATSCSSIAASKALEVALIIIFSNSPTLLVR